MYLARVFVESRETQFLYLYHLLLLLVEPSSQHFRYSWQSFERRHEYPALNIDIVKMEKKMQYSKITLVIFEASN